ncbi:DUF2267 domain-containing protein [Actinoplanes sp. NPDC049316]|uniref:DUF2267 domain-containing protein n=1 Tax=Actinoplanes sp. NPDC049316 TaxID=3154727 RepID=UPI0034490702
MANTGVDIFEHPTRTAQTWLADIARHLGTDDRHAAYRTLRAWLHTLRDRLPVNTAADFAAQLPEFFRGVFYDGWQPSRSPDKYGADEYRRRFALEAQSPIEYVDAAAAAVTAAMRDRLSPGQIDQVLHLMPEAVRRILQAPTGGAPGEPLRPVSPDQRQGPTGDTDDTVEARLARLEARIATLSEATRILAHGLHQPPTEEPDAMRAGQAARRAYEMLFAAPPDRP